MHPGVAAKVSSNNNNATYTVSDKSNKHDVVPQHKVKLLWAIHVHVHTDHEMQHWRPDINVHEEKKNKVDIAVPSTGM